MQKLHKAIRDGVIYKSQCYFCSSMKRISAHHIDYRHPLEVVWMCQRCHLGYHAKLRRIRAVFGIPTYEGQYLLLANQLELKQELSEENDFVANEILFKIRQKQQVRGFFLPVERPLIPI